MHLSKSQATAFLSKGLVTGTRPDILASSRQSWHLYAYPHTSCNKALSSGGCFEGQGSILFLSYSGLSLSGTVWSLWKVEQTQLECLLTVPPIKANRCYCFDVFFSSLLNDRVLCCVRMCVWDYISLCNLTFYHKIVQVTTSLSATSKFLHDTLLRDSSRTCFTKVLEFHGSTVPSFPH